MSRGGRAKLAEGPERRCIATGEVADPSTMIRFVVGPEGQAVPDIAGKLPGRGMWVSSDKAALDLAIQKGAFSRSAKMQVSVPDTLIAQVEQGLSKKVIERLSLARKAGQAIVGFEKVKSLLEADQAAVLIQADDGSDRGKSKLRPPRGTDTYIDCLSAQELGLAFGRESVIHGALTAGGLSKAIVEDAKRLAGVRGKSGGSTTRKEMTTHER